MIAPDIVVVADVDLVLVRGNVLWLNRLPRLREHRHVLDHVLQLAHVAAPLAGAQKLHAVVGELGKRVARLAMPLPVVRQEVIGEQRDVLLAAGAAAAA